MVLPNRYGAAVLLLLSLLPLHTEGLNIAPGEKQSLARWWQEAMGDAFLRPTEPLLAATSGHFPGGVQAVVANAVFGRSSSLEVPEPFRNYGPKIVFPVQRWYEFAWAVAIFLLIACTAAYGLAYRPHAEAVEKHRKALEQVSPAEGEKAAQEMFQRGYVDSLVGRLLYLLWVLLPTFGYTQLIFFTVDEYLLALHSPDLTWIQLAEPFLLIFAVSHLVIFLQCQYLAEAKVYFMMPSSLCDATFVLIENPQDLSSNVLVKVQVDTATDTRFFEFTCIRYLWQESLFVPVGTDTHLDAATALSRHKAGGLEDAEAVSRRAAGPNIINVQVPTALGSLANEFLDPIYCFQFSCIWMYMFYTTWNIAFIWLAMVMTSGIVKALLIVRRNQLKVQELARTEGTAWVLRGSKWEKRASGEVVPGDIVRVDEGEICCDIAVVNGGAVVNESMLTGEPMPVQRFPIDPSTAGQLCPNTHKKHFLFAGTVVMQSAGPEEGRAVGVAVSTGARTAKGSLVRMVLFPSPSSFKFTDQLRQVYALMFIYVCVLFCVALTRDQGHWIIAVFTGLCILAQALNPNLPVSLAIAQSVSAHRMASSVGVKCLAPPKVPIAGKVHVMVMDKTGTITKDGMEFAGVRPSRPEGSKGAGFETFREAVDERLDARNLKEEVAWALAACHTVTKLRDGTLVGNMVECAMLSASGWDLADDSKSVLCPLTGDRISILKPLEFDHHRMTSGAAIQVQGKAYVMVKGSYEAIQALCLPQSVPSNYKEVTEYYAKEQYYVLAVGLKELKSADVLTEVQNADRNTLESDLTLLALLLFRNEVKPDSQEAIEELAAGGIRRVMCTGDNALTGAAVGQRCGLMNDPDSKVILGEKGEGPGSILWRTLPDYKEVSHWEIMQSQEEDVDLVVTRDAFSSLLETGELDKLIKHIRVYARMKPTDKVTVIQKHQEQGWIVGMCGDGGNDCGGLRAAHIGLALSEAEASIVAPFSSSAEYGTGSKSLMALVHLVRFGRATLCANLATYSYFMVYGLTLPPAKLTVVFMGNTMLPEWDWLFIDIILGAFMVATMTLGWPSAKLACRRPTASLLGARTTTSVLLHVAIFTVFFSIAMTMLRSSDFYISYDPVKDLELPGHEWAKKGDNYHCALTFLVLANQLATAGFAYSFGAEHRRSVFLNFTLTLIYCLVLFTLFSLVLGGPTDFHCLFRVNCDQRTSKSMYIPLLQELSTGNLGGCFLGPQFKAWKTELGDDFEFPFKPTNQCKPSPTLDPEEVMQVPSGSFLWGANTCFGANNCFPASFRQTLACLLAAQVILSLGAHKLCTLWHPGTRQHFKKL
mmetsp:Transcript_48168/g.112675  ORF Transcript_48168/g.112675 Transcript_48168/m.112675 type:complete len:1326 (-) Transcript_48168:54-4031(-)